MPTTLFLKSISKGKLLVNFMTTTAGYFFSVQFFTPDMREEPFTLYEAGIVSQTFQYLTGSQMQKGKDDLIAEVVVSPYDDVNKWMFLYLYRDYKDARKALSHYSGPFYDVIVTAAFVPGGGTFVYQDIRAYLNDHQIPFDLQAILDHSFGQKNKGGKN